LSRFSQEELGRLSAGCLFAVLWAVILAKHGEDYLPDTLWWLVCVGGAGITINTRKGMSGVRLFIGALLVSTVLLITLAFLSLVAIFGKTGLPLKLSGIGIDNPVYWLILGVIYLLTVPAILMGCLARNYFIEALYTLVKSEEYLAKINRVINLLPPIVTGLALLVGALVK
jgi:hypothetical protein